MPHSLIDPGDLLRLKPHWTMQGNRMNAKNMNL